MKILSLICVAGLLWASPVMAGDGQSSNKVSLNKDLFISVRDVSKKIKSSPRPMLIDVRHESRFRKFRIPGSLNLPLFAVKTKLIFKKSSIVLLNEGYHNTPLIKECVGLREKGFDARILYGGLNAWKRNGGRIDGDVFEQETVNKVPSRIWFSEKNNTGWVCVDVSLESSENAGTFMPGAVHIPVSNDRKLFETKIRRAVDMSQTYPGTSVLVFNSTGKGYEKIEKMLATIPNLFFLENGLDGYARFLKDLALMRNRDKTKTNAGKKCRSCS